MGWLHGLLSAVAFLRCVVLRNAQLAAVFTLSAVLAIISLAHGQGSTEWTLGKIVVVNHAGDFFQIVSEHYDASGGSVEITADGRAAGLCPGGSDRLRFEWRFTSDITHLPSSGGFGGNIQARVISSSPPCAGHFANATFIALSGSGSWPFDEPRPRSVDEDRFYAVGPERAYADQSPPSVTSTGIKLTDSPIRNNEAFSSFFNVVIAIRGAPGLLYYAYFYNASGGGGETSGGGGGTELTVETNVDRPGGDYSNFDLPQANPEICRSACANDPLCKAYTYVNPGVQGPNARCWLKSSIPPAVASTCCTSGTKGSDGGGGGGGGEQGFTVEADVNRYGSDYMNFDPSQPDYRLCLAACANDSRCMAYTYVKPGAKGPNAWCWLKSSAPAPTADNCCVSGMRR